MNSPRKWDEALEAEFITPEEIEESDRRVAEIQRSIEKAQEPTTDGDLVRREDLLRQLRKIPGYRDEESEVLIPLRDVCKIVNLAQATPGQVVRCRNCEYGNCTGIEWRCEKHSHSRNDNALGEDRHYIEYHDGDWYCADGEKREAWHER